YTGCWFLWLGISQILHGFFRNFPHLLIEYANRPLFEFYHSFLLDIVSPNAQMFSVILLAAEIIIGLLFLLGLLTRLATLLGFLVTASYFLALSKAGTTYLAMTLTGMIVVLVLSGAAAGRIWGMDASLYRRTLFKYFT